MLVLDLVYNLCSFLLSFCIFMCENLLLLCRLGCWTNGFGFYGLKKKEREKEKLIIISLRNLRVKHSPEVSELKRGNRENRNFPVKKVKNSHILKSTLGNLPKGKSFSIYIPKFCSAFV